MLTFGQFRIDQDENNYIIQQEKQRKNGDMYWYTLAYYGVGHLDLALQNVLMRKIQASEKDELRHVLKVLAETKKEIMDAVEELKTNGKTE